MYRSYNYRLKDKPVGQSFSREVPKLDIDPEKHVLVQVGTKDLQAFVQSSADCALGKILEKYGVLPSGSNLFDPSRVSVSDDVYIDDVHDDLQYMNDVSQDLEDIRDRYGFSDSMTYEQISDALLKRSNELSDIINKGGKANETSKSEPPQVGSSVSPNCEKDSSSQS